MTVETMTVREYAVEQARSKGLCTQCLIHTAAEHRQQCQRCIDTNRRKYRRRTAMNKCKCGEEAQEGKKSCPACLEKARAYWRKRYAAQKARKKAFSGKDVGTTKRTYNKRVPIASLQMAGMVNDLERFIVNLKMMSAIEYLAAREALIESIIKRGGGVYGSTT